MKKVSDAALDGLAQVKGQNVMRMYNRATDCACFEGCVAIGYGVPKAKLDGMTVTTWLEGKPKAALIAASDAFKEATGIWPTQANDEEEMRIEDIAGILRAEGH